MQIRESIASLLESVQQDRRSLHRIPEIGLNTIKTKNYIKERLQVYHDLVIEEGYAKNGLVAFLSVQGATKTIAFRSDMDGLPIEETNEIEFISQHKGCSHACGHDGHMSILLGFIDYLMAHKEFLKANVLCIFQPGEEGPGGAKMMLQEGLFEKYPVSYVFGTHLMADVEKGKIACKAGLMMARNGEFNIELFGQSAHGAMPHLGKDAIVAASHLVVQLQSLSHMVDPLHSTVLSVGTMQGGQARNVLCDHMRLQGTIRAFEDTTYQQIKNALLTTCECIAKAFQVEVKAEVLDYYYAVDNDAKLYTMLANVSKDDLVEQQPKMIAEDFSFFQREVSGLFFFTGTKDEFHQKGIHDSAFNFDEQALLVAIETYVRILEGLGGMQYD